MEFKKIGFNYLNFEANENLPSKASPSYNVKNEKYKQTPVDPNYWRAVSFSGRKAIQNNPDCYDEIVSEYANGSYDFPKKMLKRNLPLFVNKTTNTLNKIALDAMADSFFLSFYERLTFNSKTNKYEMGLLTYSDVLKEEKLPSIVEAMKNANGVFNKDNCDFMKKVIKNSALQAIFIDNDCENFNLLKDENGIINKEYFDKVSELININRYFSSDLNSRYTSEDIKKYINFLNQAGIEKTDEIFDYLSEKLDKKRCVLPAVCDYYNNCYDSNGNKIQENIDFINKICVFAGKGPLYAETYSFINSEDDRNLLIELLAKGVKYKAGNLRNVAELMNKFQDENGNFDKNVRELLLNRANSELNIEEFNKIIDVCTKDNDDKKEVDVKLANLVFEFYKNFEIKGVQKIKPKKFIKIMENPDSVKNLTFADKVYTLDAINNMDVEDENYIKQLDDLTFEIEKSISSETKIMPVEAKNVEVFNSVVFDGRVSDNKELTPFEEVMVESIPKLRSMKKNGLPLKYNRSEFLKDLSSLLDDNDKKELFERKAGVELIIKDGEIKGYDGIISLDEFDKNNEFENKIYEKCHKFFYENEVQTGDKKLDDALNVIIKGIPEFINAIGKTQHGTHKYSLDIHQLLVLAYSLDNPEYKNLNKTEKAILKFCTIAHDITKKEDEIDEGHQDGASIYAQSISKRFIKNGKIQDRIYDFVKNHHWLKEYNESKNKEETAKKMAFTFRRSNDFTMAKIFAKADLIGVSDEFYNEHKDALTKESLSLIEDKLNEFYSSGCAVFSDYPKNMEKLENHKEIINGREFKVINLHKIADNEDLSEYGFEKGKTKDSLYFLIHVVDSNKIKSNLNKLKFLSKSANCGVISQSLNTVENKNTYFDRPYGVILSDENSNIINVSPLNQSSGVTRKKEDAINLIFGLNDNTKETRKNFRNLLLKELNIDPKTITDEEFAKFYKENIINKDSLSQIVDSKIYNIGKHGIKGENLKNAILNYQKYIAETDTASFNNEIVGYIPKIKAAVAKVEDVNDIPDELLDFAYENNLPIVLL